MSEVKFTKKEKLFIYKHSYELIYLFDSFEKFESVLFDYGIDIKHTNDIEGMNFLKKLHKANYNFNYNYISNLVLPKLFVKEFEYELIWKYFGYETLKNLYPAIIKRHIKEINWYNVSQNHKILDDMSFLRKYKSKLIWSEIATLAYLWNPYNKKELAREFHSYFKKANKLQII